MKTAPVKVNIKPKKYSSKYSSEYSSHMNQNYIFMSEKRVKILPLLVHFDAFFQWFSYQDFFLIFGPTIALSFNSNF